MNPKIIIELSEKVNDAILSYQDAYKQIHNKRAPSKSDIIGIVMPQIEEAINAYTEEMNKIKSLLNESKIK